MRFSRSTGGRATLPTSVDTGGRTRARPTLRLAAVVGLATFALATGGRANADVLDDWHPRGIAAPTVTLAEALADVRADAGSPQAAYAERSESLELRVGERTFASTRTIRGEDFVARTDIAGESYAQGRRDGRRWRETPRGSVRFVQSDVQGDDLDRWPIAIVGFRASDVTLFGETTGAAPCFVFRALGEHEFPHFVYVDKATGFPTREISREGSRTESITFDDERTVGGVRRPFAWHVRGGGTDLDVVVAAVTTRSVSDSEVAVPASRAATFVPTTAPYDVPVVFNRYLQPFVAARFGGDAIDAVLDTGTPQTTISRALARALHLDIALGHAIVPSITIGNVSIGRSVPALVVAGDAPMAIVGEDFFQGRTIRIDYRGATVRIAPPGAKPPDDARPVAIDWSEGMPLVSASFGAANGSRFVIDTGSSEIVLGRGFVSRSAEALARDGLSHRGETSRIDYLEGGITVRAVAFDDLFAFGRHFAGPAEVEEDRPGDDTYFAIDGILGSEVLSRFTWWFDADGTTWIVPN